LAEAAANSELRDSRRLLAAHAEVNANA
jgi:hypothetical protein